MASNFCTLFLVTFTLLEVTTQNTKTNEVEDDSNPIADIAKTLLKEQNVDNIGGLINTFIHSDGGKQIGDMLAGAMSGSGNSNVGAASAQILQGLSNIVGQGKEDDTDTARKGGFDPNLIGTVLSLLVASKESPRQKHDEDGFDVASLLSTVVGMFTQQGPESYVDYLPTILSTLSSFVGPEAQSREQGHADHAFSMPPILEKLHVMSDHFMHSDFGISLMEKIGAEKVVKIFSDETGKFSYPKFVELLENRSFRKHWIKMVTQRVAEFVSYFADPYTQKKFTNTVQFFINNFLKGQGIPKAALFDPTRPTETISALLNHLSKRFFGYKYDSKKYVQPAVTYIQDVLKMAEERGIVGRGIDSDKLTNKLADTLNLEIIEPVVRVNRAFRFASKVPQCDRYVMCLVNQDTLEDEDASLPGLKKALSKGTSMILSWFLSSRTGTSYWSLYHVITEENNCQARFLEECNEFHVEEIKVTTEYVHNEL